MQYPIDLHIGDFVLSTHLACEVLGFMVAYRYYLYLRKKQIDRITTSKRAIIMIAGAGGGFLFSRILGAFEHPSAFLHSDHLLLYFYSDKTIVGGLLGGLLAIEITKKIIHETRSSGDLFAYPMILGMLIGRIGCFSMGVLEDTYGTVTTSALGMDLGDGLKRHPVVLYEMVFLIAVWITLKLVERKVTFKDGYRFKLFLISYLFFRFLLDFIKPGDRYLLGLGTIQISCIFGLIYYSKTILTVVFKPSRIVEHE